MDELQIKVSAEIEDELQIKVSAEIELQRAAAKSFNYEDLVRRKELKVHRFPERLRAGLSDQYVVPLVVAIGPYHHGLPRLQEMESVKRVAADHFICHFIIGNTCRSYQDVYCEVTSIANRVRGFYDVVGMDDLDFVVMMFHDACFLLQYMVPMSGQLLHPFFFSNQASIDNDIMLLENQLPWQVVEYLMRFMPNHKHVVETFLARLASTFQSRQGTHLLGLFRSYINPVERSKPVCYGVGISVPVSATNLAGVGIKLRPSDTWDLSDIGIRRGLLFDDFFLPPLYLDNLRACWLVNMAALELCTTPSFSNGDSYVCSYLALIAMLMNREEDVHHAREKRFLQGEITDKQMLSFFNTITELISPGQGYFNILADIEACKRRRWVRIMVQKFFSDNAKAIAAVLSVVGVLVGIFKTLFSLKQHQP